MRPWSIIFELERGTTADAVNEVLKMRVRLTWHGILGAEDRLQCLSITEVILPGDCRRSINPGYRRHTGQVADLVRQ